ncbi:hypothetical protein ACQKH5_00125 [Hyphomonas sp. NPDC076900]|uniref:hypothetical protein n=1 Tax=unclassified Hyphomonas TaxID=2630699 RepID=UPI003CFDB35F
MLQNRFVPLGFLSIGVLAVIGPMIAFAIASSRLSDEATLSNTYYVAADGLRGLSYPAVSALFALAYWAAIKGRLVFRPGLLWAHLALWTLGCLLVFAPQFLTPILHVSYFDDPSKNFARLNTVSTLGYCVTLLSFAVFAICIGEAILRRIRRKKAL